MSADTIYEYAGFLYHVVRPESMMSMEPVAGQHPAAAKDKHRRAALQCYLMDQGKTQAHNQNRRMKHD